MSLTFTVVSLYVRSFSSTKAITTFIHEVAFCGATDIHGQQVVESEDTDGLSPEEFREWLQNWHKSELVRARLQSAEATEIASGYINGELTQDQTNDRWIEYCDRWGESPLEAINHPENMGDGQVMKLIRRNRTDIRGR